MLLTQSIPRSLLSVSVGDRTDHPEKTHSRVNFPLSSGSRRGLKSRERCGSGPGDVKKTLLAPHCDRGYVNDCRLWEGQLGNSTVEISLASFQKGRRSPNLTSELTSAWPRTSEFSRKMPAESKETFNSTAGKGHMQFSFLLSL